MYKRQMPDDSVKADIIYLCSPNNPTGACYNKEQLKAWVDYALENEAVILFDSAYEAFVSEPDLPRSIYAVEGAEKCAVEFCSLSKTCLLYTSRVRLYCRRETAGTACCHGTEISGGRGTRPCKGVRTGCLLYTSCSILDPTYTFTVSKKQTAAGCAAVSYTHLDVYKRQVYCGRRPVDFRG